jgi:hypothetical protein
MLKFSHVKYVKVSISSLQHVRFNTFRLYSAPLHKSIQHALYPPYIIYSIANKLIFDERLKYFNPLLLLLQQALDRFKSREGADVAAGVYHHNLHLSHPSPRVFQGNSKCEPPSLLLIPMCSIGCSWVCI